MNYFYNLNTGQTSGGANFVWPGIPENVSLDLGPVRVLTNKGADKSFISDLLDKFRQTVQKMGDTYFHPNTQGHR